MPRVARAADGSVLRVARAADGSVLRVARVGAGRPPPGLVARTRHFALYPEPLLVHDLPPERIDNDLADLLSEELFGPGLLAGQQVFEACFVGVVQTMDPDPDVCWESFYRNTLAGLCDESRCVGAVGTFGAIYRVAIGLRAGDSAVDVGSCFGFFPILLAHATGRPVLGSDLSAGATGLAARMAGRLGVPASFVAADAGRLPLADRAVDTAYCLHVLEHLPAAAARRVLAELVRVARRRVVVAVPYEPTPDPTYGHLQAFDPAGLAALGRSAALPYEVRELHGGWLVLDTDGPTR